MRRKQLAGRCGLGGLRARAERGEGAALPGDGADKVHEVSGGQTVGFPLEEARAQRMPSALRQIKEGVCESLQNADHGQKNKCVTQTLD